jgi:hypothetical protein
VLRQLLLSLGITLFLLGVFFVVIGLALPFGLYLCVSGAILAFGVLFERRGYRPRVNRTSDTWQETSERFIDPVSGHLIVVHYNPETGERDYVDKGAAKE